jgi:hypothetical protein
MGKLTTQGCLPSIVVRGCVFQDKVRDSAKRAAYWWVSSSGTAEEDSDDSSTPSSSLSWTELSETASLGHHTESYDYLLMWGHSPPVSIWEALAAELITRVASFVCVREAMMLMATASQVREAVLPATHASKNCAIFVCGGGHGNMTLKSVERYLPAERKWEQMPDMSQRRRCAAAVVMMSHLYILGGSNGARVLNSVERFRHRDEHVGGY